VLVLVGTSLACSDEVIEIPEQLRGKPACAWVGDSRVHFADGSHRLIYDEKAGWTGAACLCLSEEEFESKFRDDEFNHLALEICHDLAAQHDFAWSECQMDYESERWLDLVYWSVGDLAHPASDELGCVGE
jgi:hypothetical protein